MSTSSRAFVGNLDMPDQTGHIQERGVLFAPVGPTAKTQICSLDF